MIELINVSKKYVSKKKVETRALDNVNLKFENKGMVFIIGKTGCGKSTLLNLLGKLDEPTSGEILVDGENISNYSQTQNDEYRQNQVGFVFQEYNLIDELTVYQNIALANKLQGKKEDAEEINSLLKRFEMLEQKDKLCNELSGGQKQRTSIIRALLKKPKIILADEPTGAVDSKTGEEVLSALKELSKEVLVIVVTHDLDFANRYGDRIIEMVDGKVVNDSLSKLDEVGDERVKAEPAKSQKGGLPIKDIVKLGAFNFKHRIRRLILTIFISICAFTMMGFSIPPLTYDKEKLILNEMYKVGDEQFYVSNALDGNEFETPISVEIQGDFEERYSRGFIPVFENYKGDIEENLRTYSISKRNYLYDGKIYGGMEINENIANSLKTKLLHGRYPTQDDEIVISKYIYMHFTKYGYKNSKMSTSVETFEDLQDKTLTLNDIDFKIVGVLDNDFLDERYQELEEDYDMNMIAEYREYLRTSLNGYVFFNTGFYQHIKENNYTPNLLENVDLRVTKRYGSYTDFFKLGTNFAKMSLLDGEVVWKDGIAKETLGENEMVVTLRNIANSSHQINGKNFTELVSYYKAMINNDKSYENTQEYNELKLLLDNNEITQNQFNSKLSDLIADMATRQVIDGVIFQDMEGIYLEYFTRDVFEQKVNVVGVVIEDNSQYNANIVSDELYNKILTSFRLYDYVGLFTSTSNFKADLHMLRDIHKYDKALDVNSRYVFNIFNVDEVVGQVAPFVLIGAIVLTIFSGLLFFNYIKCIIDDKRKQIGVLRSLGATKKDIAGIFLVESLIISLIITVFACALSAIIIAIINNKISVAQSLMFNLFSFGIVPIIIVLGVSVLVAVIATIIPVIRITKRKPVENLRNV